MAAFLSSSISERVATYVSTVLTFVENLIWLRISLSAGLNTATFNTPSEYSNGTTYFFLLKIQEISLKLL